MAERSVTGGELYPLVGRPPGAVLFRTARGAITAECFVATATRLAGQFGDGGFVVNLCQDRAAFALVFAATLLAGAVSLLAGERSPERLRRLGRDFPGAVSVSEDAAVMSPLPHRLIVPDWVGRGTASVPVPARPGGQLAAVVFTSGSTGAPVAHRKLWGALAERSIAAAAQFALDPARPVEILGTVPPQHMYGFETTILLPLHAPAASWSGTAFYPDDVRRALSAMPPPTLLVTTPLQLRGLLEAAGLPAPGGVISATAPLDRALAQAAEARWGGLVREIFGATELGSVASRRTVDGDIWTLYPDLTLAGAAECWTIAAPFAPPTALSDTVSPVDGRRFRLLGRRTDLVKLAGRRASLSGLNRILAGIPGVQDGVFLAPDDLDRRTSARLIVLVVAPERSAEDILADLRPRIDAVFLPRRVTRVAALPRNELGKLPRAALLALAAGTGDG